MIETDIFGHELFSNYRPVVDSAGTQVCVEDCDDSRCCVSKNGIVNDIQEVDQLRQTNKHRR